MREPHHDQGWGCLKSGEAGSRGDSVWGKEFDFSARAGAGVKQAQSWALEVTLFPGWYERNL